MADRQRGTPAPATVLLLRLQLTARDATPCRVLASKMAAALASGERLG
jgi:hypothetical protein